MRKLRPRRSAPVHCGAPGARNRARAAGRLLAAALLLAAGCGYQFSDSSWNLPPDVRSISVGKIANETRQFGLEKSLAFALEREVRRRGGVELVEEPGGGDAVLTGTIRGFNVQPVAFDVADEALQYEVTLVVDLHLQRNSDGHILWEVSGLRESEEYSSVSRVIVTSSSEFQRGNLDPADLSKFKDIQIAESSRRRAVERLLDSTVRDVYALLAQDF